MTEKVKFGIIGVGNMGSGHLRFFMNGDVHNGRVTAIADINPEKLKLAKEKCPGDYVCYGSAEDLIGKSDVDAVIIATPHILHPPLAIAALKAGKHVLS